MATQYLRDNHMTIIGRIETDKDGDQTCYNSHGWLVGRYIKASNATYDEHGILVGYGNLLATLLR